MAAVLQLEGMEQVLANFKSAEKQIIKGLERGLKKGGLFLQRESQKIVPVDKGDLKGSAFTRFLRRGKNADVIVGYTKLYAVYVHEDLEKLHGREYNQAYGKAHIRKTKSGKLDKRFREKLLRGENQQAKFLERPAREKRREILGIIYKEAKSVR